MGRPIIQIVGMKFSKLLVTEFSHVSESGRAYWKCICDCGKEVVSSGRDLRNGGQKSCGCLRSENMSGLRHGKSGTLIYKTWVNMLTRCRNPNSDSYKHYGARGISVSEEWLSFEKFYEDMGDRPFPEAQIDRINNDMGYCKSNCKWSTPRENSNNRRSSRFVKADGQTMTVTQCARKYGLKHRNTLLDRLNSGWPIEKAVSTKSRKG